MHRPWHFLSLLSHDAVVLERHLAILLRYAGKLHQSWDRQRVLLPRRPHMQQWKDQSVLRSGSAVSERGDGQRHLLLDEQRVQQRDDQRVLWSGYDVYQ